MHGEFLGACRYYHNGRTIEGLDARQAGFLLAYIFLHHDRSFTREHLAETVWDKDSSLAVNTYKRLRQELYRINRALKPIGKSLSDIIDIKGNTFELKQENVVTSDACVFEQCIDQSLGVAASQLRDCQISAMLRAIDIYRGKLLPTLDANWCLVYRERLQIMYVECIEKLALSYEIRKQHELALHYARLVLDEDPLTESAHRIIMRCQYQLGNAPLAVRQFRKLSDTLYRELGPDIGPMPETHTLLQQIKPSR